MALAFGRGFFRFISALSPYSSQFRHVLRLTYATLTGAAPDDPSTQLPRGGTSLDSIKGMEPDDQRVQVRTAGAFPLRGPVLTVQGHI
jgi:hypothetical protein